MNKYYLFDIDGTITPPRQKITDEFGDLFLKWMKNKKIILVTGSDLKKVLEQVPIDILNETYFVACCSGNYIVTFENGISKVESKNEFKDSQVLTDYLLYEMKHSYWREKTGNHFEYRTGTLNFSIVGRNADIKQRNEYEEFDKKLGERAKIVNYINNNFPNFEARIGGQISIDITERGKNKGQVVDFLAQISGTDLFDLELEFYGDKITNGNDTPLAMRVWGLGGNVFEVEGPEMTRFILINN